MTDEAHVRSIDALADLDAGLIQFRSRAGGTLTVVSLEIQRMYQWLESRLRHWEDEVSYWTAQLDDDDDLGSLGASASLRRAESEVVNVRMWTDLFDSAAGEYNARSRGLADRLENGSDRASTELRRAINAVSRYGR